MEIQRILVTGRIHQELKELIRLRDLPFEFRFLSEADITIDDYDWADAFVGFQPPPNFEFGHIKWVHSLGAGVDKFLALDWKEDVLLTRTTNVFGAKMSEYCLSYILQDAQRHSDFAASQAKSEWEVRVPKTLRDQKVVIFGTGDIGSTIGKTLQMFGMKVIGVSKSGAPNLFIEQVVPFQSASALLVDADWVINTLPLTNKTHGLIDGSVFTQLNQAGFIHVGRGPTIDEALLLQALKDGHVRRAILDVFPVEPLSKESVLWRMPNVTITPHISAVTLPENAANSFLETLSCLEKEYTLRNKVDIEKGY